VRKPAHAFLAASVVILTLTASAPASALPPDPRPEPRFHVRDRLIIDAWAMTSAAGGHLERRSVRNALDLAWTNGPVIGVFSASTAFDASLPGRPSHALVRERQLQPELMRAWVRWTTPTGATLQAGRHDLLSAAGFARIDGATARLSAGRLTVAASAGIRPDDRVGRIDGWAYLPDTERDERADFADRSAIIEGSIGATDDVVAVNATVRHERALDGGTVDGTTLGVGSRFGDVDGVRLDSRARVHAPTLTPERIDLTLRVPVTDTVSLLLSERRAEPRFPAGNLFSVFPTTIYGEERAGAALALGRSHVRVSALHRMVRPANAPVHSAARTGGFELVAGHRSPAGRVRSGGAVSITRGARADAARVSARVSAAPRRGPEWHVAQSVATEAIAHSGLGRRTGSYLSAGVSGWTGDRAALAVVVTAGWDNRSGLSSRVLATADIGLPGASR
jgi:hypothetical protein